MQYSRLFLLLLAFSPILLSCDEGGLCLKGEGDVETRSLDVADLEGIRVGGNSRVFIRKGSPQRVEVKGQPNVLDELETEVRDGVWEVGLNRCLRDHDPVEVYVTTPELNKASVGGSGYVELEDVFESNEFDASVSGSGDIKLRLAANRLNSRISGSGTITAAGVATRHDISISGSGRNSSLDLTTREADVDISGSGRAELNVEDRLDVDISGSGRVYHWGNPSINADVSGSGKVIKKERE
ncbi:head GIN domain-containing protein [Pontibacter pamirensis]|uniref:head GIN domain-containing protein n=1 Tax=Pontibacter pamirensis TaxID=2562824 RepID=UPI0013895F9F|nr:head GIN domain-containing protein [Pontibacter pamirensis]